MERGVRLPAGLLLDVGRRRVLAREDRRRERYAGNGYFGPKPAEGRHRGTSADACRLPSRTGTMAIAPLPQSYRSPR